MRGSYWIFTAEEWASKQQLFSDLAARTLPEQNGYLILVPEEHIEAARARLNMEADARIALQALDTQAVARELSRALQSEWVVVGYSSCGLQCTWRNGTRAACVEFDLASSALVIRAAWCQVTITHSEAPIALIRTLPLLLPTILAANQP